jgi:hypothetical protein
MTKLIIMVELPNGTIQKFTTFKYERIDDRIIFVDRKGERKDFPSNKCFIEEYRGGF